MTVTMTSKYFLIFVCIIPIRNIVQCLQLDASPTEVEPGLTQTLTLLCSFSSADNLNMAYLYSLILSHSFDNGTVFEDLVSISVHDEQVKLLKKDGITNGTIYSQGDSFVSFQWSMPFFHMAGIFKCEAFGLGSTWRSLTLAATTHVAVHELSLKSVSKQLLNIALTSMKQRHQFEAMNRSVAETNDLLSPCLNAGTCLQMKHVLDNITRQMDCVFRSRTEKSSSLESNFIESPVYNGRRYYLTHPMNSFDVKLADETCQWHGGYLAEIDNDFEFNFVKSFLKNVTSAQLIWISGSEEVEEGNWIHLRNNLKVTYLKWISGKQAVDRKFNCLCLDKNFDYNMKTCFCVHKSNLKDEFYLCEIPE